MAADSENIAGSGHVPGGVAPRDAAILPPGTPGPVQGPLAQQPGTAEPSTLTGVKDDADRLLELVEGSFAGISPLELKNITFCSSSTSTSTRRTGATLYALNV